MDLLVLTVPGDPIPKGRPRTGSGKVYTPARTRDAEDVVRVLARQAYGPRAAYAGAVGIVVSFWCATRRRTDGDNLLKLITDGLQRGRRPAGGDRPATHGIRPPTCLSPDPLAQRQRVRLQFGRLRVQVTHGSLSFFYEP